MEYNWLLIALIAPFLWALVTVLDNYFVHSVYQDEYDGVVVSGFFQLLPWLLVVLGLVEFQYPGHRIASLALLSGAFFLGYLFFYFKALFISNDSAMADIFSNLSVVFVPFIAWLFIHEKLTLTHYGSVGIAFIGILIFFFDREIVKSRLNKFTFFMVLSAVFLSISMVVSKGAFQDVYDFWSIFLLFCLGGFISGLFFLIISPKSIADRIRRLFWNNRHQNTAFFISEALSVVATLASQRAISLAPAVSYIAIIESLVPVFVMTISLVLAWWFGKLGLLKIQKVYQQQFSSFVPKLIGTILLVVSIYIIS